MVKDFFILIFTFIENFFYNLFHKTKEFFIFFPDIRFFSLDILLYFVYFFTSPFSQRRIYNNIPVSFDELTYGEVYYYTARDILNRINFSSDDILFDLGSGRGKMVFFASLYFGAKAVGIDIIPTFIIKSQWLAKILNLNVEFIENDFRKSDLSKATVIYLAGTCLSDDSLAELMEHLRNIASGARIVSLSYPLRADFFKLISKDKMYFSWGKTSVFFHERL